LSRASAGIFTGLQSSADSVYIVEDRGPRDGARLVYSKASDRELLLEPELLHPLASGGEVERYAFKPLDDLLLFPYRRDGEQMRLVTEAELADLPLALAYLNEHEEALRGREGGKMDHPGWHAFGRTQSLGLHDLPKLGIPRLCDRLRASVDPDGAVYLDNVDVNGVLPSEEGPGVWTLACLLNSSLLDYVFKLISVPFRGSFYSANKQFVSPLPIRLPDAGTEAAFDALGPRLHEAVGAFHRERRDFRAWLSDLIGVRVSELAGRTRLERHEALTAAEIVEILLRSRQSLSLDPGSRSFRDRLVAEHVASVEKLNELSLTIRRAEAEVEEAVFALYEVGAQHRAMVGAAA
jgi:hypothetical protein